MLARRSRAAEQGLLVLQARRCHSVLQTTGMRRVWSFTPSPSRRSGAM